MTGLRSDQVRGLGPPGRRDVIYADDFGMVPGSSRDMTDPFLRAQDRAIDAGKVLVIPPGTYDITNASFLAGINLLGFGRHTVLRRSDSASPHVLLVDAVEVVIENLAIDGNAALAGATGSGSITITADDVTLRRVWVSNMHAHGIRVVAASNVLIDDCTVISATDDGAGIVYHGGGGGSTETFFTVRDCFVDKSGADDGAGIATALNQAGANVLRGIEISRNRVFGASGAICIETFTGGVDDFTSDLMVVNNRTFGGTMGISVPHTRGGVIQGNVDRWDGTLPGTGSWGLEIIGCIGTSVTGNAVYGRDVGVTLNSSSHCTVSDNTLVDIGVVNSDATSFAIVMSDAVSQPEANQIVNNNIYNTFAHGIVVRGDAGGYIVADNLIDGIGAAGDAAIQYGGAGGTSGDLNCRGNTIRNSAVGIRFEGAVSFTGIVADNNMNETVTTPFELASGANVDAVRFHDNPPAVNGEHRSQVHRSSNLLSSNGVPITMLFTDVEYDIGDMVDLTVDASEVVIQEPGVYGISGTASWASNNAGRRVLQIRHTAAGPTVTTHGSTTQNADVVGSHNQATGYVEIPCVAGDVIELLCTYAGVGVPATLNLTSGMLTVRRVT